MREGWKHVHLSRIPKIATIAGSVWPPKENEPPSLERESGLVEGRDGPRNLDAQLSRSACSAHEQLDRPVRHIYPIILDTCRPRRDSQPARPCLVCRTLPVKCHGINVDP